MTEFVVYRILKDSESHMKSFDYYDVILKEELFHLLTFNHVIPEETLVPDDSNGNWEKSEQLTYMGFPMLKKLQYHRRTAGVKISFTAQLRWDDE